MSLHSASEKMAKSLSDVLLYEVDSRWSRESGELAPLDESLPMGAVLALDASGKLVPFGFELEAAQPAVEAAEGVEAKEAVPAKLADEACAILISREMPASAETRACAVVRRGACVARESLYWLKSVTDEQKTTALAQLAALGIVPKE